MPLKGRVELLPRGFFGFQKFSDTVEHIALSGDTLWQIAAKYYSGQYSRAALMYWVIADFQPEPITDPTLVILAGTKIYVPSIKVIEMYIFSPSRAPEFETW
jgi:nucleoid-associated protein YgaU